jgi:hypothetical protein
MNLYSETACSNFGKTGGIWEFIWNLPYPKEVVLKTIELDCGNRMEYVSYSNFLCEWLKKIEQ